MVNITLFTAIAGLGFGLIGTSLGLINTWRGISRDRVKVRVKPVVKDLKNGLIRVGAEIINNSQFSITIQDIGFILNDHKEWKFPPQELIDLPQRMESRTSFTAVIFGSENQQAEWKNIRKAFILTACGKRVTGKSQTFHKDVSRIDFSKLNNHPPKRHMRYLSRGIRIGED